jgi:hypothetical protein
VRVRADQPVDEGEEAAGNEGGAGEVEMAPLLVARLADGPEGDRRRDRADRDVDPEDRNRRDEPRRHRCRWRSRRTERVLVAGTAVAGAAVLVGALIHFAVADSGDRGVAGEAIRTLNILDQNSWIAWNSGLGLMMLGAGTTALSHAAVLPRWLAWLAVAVGILLFVPFVDFFALLLTLIWIIATSILLYRAQKPEIAEVATLTA